MSGSAVETDASVAGEQRRGGDRPSGASTAAVPRSPEHDRVSERDELRAEVQRLETELERYRAHAERTSKLFLSATRYADWVRENARRDAELALRKASARVERLEAAASELEAMENELSRRQAELARLQALTDETRARLSAFLTAGLEALDTDVPPRRESGLTPALGDLHETLQRQLTSAPTSGPIGEDENREL